MRRSGIHYISEIVVKEEHVERFRAHLAETIAAVKATEAKTIEYIAYISRDGKRCQVDQWYADANALKAHLKGEAVKRNNELFQLADFFRIWIYTDIEDQEINDVFASLNTGGDKVLMGPAFGGFDRTLGFDLVPPESSGHQRNI